MNRHETAVLDLAGELAEDLLATLDLDHTVGRLAERLREFIPYDSLALYLLDDLGQEYRIRYAVGYAKDTVENWRFGPGQGTIGEAARTKKEILIEDVPAGGFMSGAEQARSELAIPLLDGGHALGVLDVGSRDPGAFTEDHRRLLGELGSRLARAVKQVRTFENLREQAATLSLLHEVSRELTSILDRNTLFKRVAELVKRLADFQMFSVMLWNEDTQLLDHTFLLRYDERFRQKGGFRLGQGITGTAAALRQSVRVPNVTLDPRYESCGHGVEVRSELAVPLLFKDRLIGVLDLESVTYNAFSLQDELMLAILAPYIAIAIENAGLYAKVTADEQRLERELATARNIQKDLLPSTPPSLPGLEIAFVYQPARQLGGDFYDFLPYEGGRSAIAVGDVAGKSTAAALMASLAIGILREHVVAHPCGPSEMLATLNERLLRSPVENRFVALAYAVHNPKDRTFTVANAGFTRPHRIRNGRVEEIPVNGVPLGLLPDITYHEEVLELQSGDVIIFCSDGIEECMNTRREHFGVERLQELLIELAAGAAQEIAGGILQATDAYAAGKSEQSDDRTVLVLKVR